MSEPIPAEASDEPARPSSATLEQVQVLPKYRVDRIPEAADDFIRNYLLRLKLTRTLDTFQTEWYERLYNGTLSEEDAGSVPDVYRLNQELDTRLKKQREEVEKWKGAVKQLEEQSDKVKKERDFHRMHHKRVGQEKNKLLGDIQKVQEEILTLQPQLDDWKDRYETLRKERMMVQLEKERLEKQLIDLGVKPSTVPAPPVSGAATPKQPAGVVATPAGPVTQLRLPGHNTQNKTPAGKQATTPAGSMPNSPPASAAGAKNRSPVKQRPAGTAQAQGSSLPAENRPNPWMEKQVPPPTWLNGLRTPKTFKAHERSIAALSIHPSKDLLVTCSDDHSWKMWSIDALELIMEGEGHRDWVSDSDFHPKGTHLVTSSGDSTVKLWSFADGKCAATFTEHQQPVWSCAFHDTGDFVLTGSMDRTCKLWDLHTNKSKMVLRGHVDSVNQVAFLPYSNVAASCSGDKSVSLWDVRSGLCLQTFYGHKNSCNHVIFNNRGDTMASSDADGVVKVWDVRMVKERFSLDGGAGFAANKLHFDSSGTHLAVPSDDASTKIFEVVDGKKVVELRTQGRESCNAAVFDQAARRLANCSADGTVTIWS